MARERKRAAAPAKEMSTAERNSAKRRYIELSYRLIEYKIMYYYPDLISEGYHDGLTISDNEYDKLEMEYLRICKTLGYKNTIVHKGYPGLEDVPGEGMFEVDFTRPAVHLVMRKWGIKNWQAKAGLKV